MHAFLLLASLTGALAIAPKNCQSLGSLTNCSAIANHSYCGTSSDPKADFNDGTGCACTFGFEFVDGKCKGSAPPGSSFCGASWADASTCKHPKCANEQDCPPDASLCFASITCGGPGPDPKNCNDPGTKTKCNSTDPNAYCGTSTDPAAQFNDGSGCSCDFGFTFNGVKCVGDPAKGTSYCGASWKDATTCTHGACHNADDCPAAAGNCYSSIDCK